MTAQPRSIAAQQNYSTAYEIGLYGRHGELLKVIGYTVRINKHKFLDYASKNRDLIVANLTEEELDQNWKYSTIYGLQFGAVSIRKTGRTERDAAQSIGKIN
jgi:hypothetical protein